MRSERINLLVDDSHSRNMESRYRELAGANLVESIAHPASGLPVEAVGVFCLDDGCEHGTSARCLFSETSRFSDPCCPSIGSSGNPSGPTPSGPQARPLQHWCWLCAAAGEGGTRASFAQPYRTPADGAIQRLVVPGRFEGSSQRPSPVSSCPLAPPPAPPPADPREP